MSGNTIGSANMLLARLPRRQRVAVTAQCEVVELEFAQILCEAEEHLGYLYFPCGASLALVATINGNSPLEMGVIGSEGMLGATLILGVPQAPLRAVVQGPGSALRLRVNRFTGVVRANPALLPLLGRYLYVQLAQLGHNAACTHYHEVHARLVRWLLLTHDRTQGDNFHLTHQFLADMLGVRRSAVTIAAGALQQRSLIRYSRGEITILDREGLEAICCPCYAALRADYAKLLS